MYFTEMTIEQKQAIVSLRPELEARYQSLRQALSGVEAAEAGMVEIEPWKIALAVADVESVLAAMFPAVEDEEGE